jgi:hypothetical protein
MKSDLHFAISRFCDGRYAASMSELDCMHARDEDWNTGLHLSCLYKHRNVIEILLGMPHVQVNATNKKGFTPLQLAEQAGLAETFLNFSKTQACGTNGDSLCRPLLFIFLQPHIFF